MFVSRQATILHADLDAFYASVEQRDDPRLRGRPVIVGGGVVLAASYEAKACGVRTAMGGAQARRLCPRGGRRAAAHVGLLGGEQGACSRSSTTRRRSSRGSRSTRRSSTCAAWSGSPARRVEIAARLRRDVRERVGLPITVGVARTKFLAKVASGVAKPDGLLVVPPEGELAFLHPLPVERLWGVGRGDRARSCTARASRRSATSRGSTEARSSRCSAGPRARHLHALAHNRDPRRRADAPRAGARSARSARSAARPHAGRARRRSWSRSSTASRAACAPRGRVGRTVVLRLRFDDFTRATRSHTMPQADRRARSTMLDAARALLAAAQPLIERARADAGRHRGHATSTTTDARAARAAVRRGDGERARRGARRGARPLRHRTR